jgi:Fe-S oxidoreductase
MGGHFDVQHHTQFLARLVREGRLPPLDLDHTQTLASPVTFHDPCYLARVGGETLAPRVALQAALGDQQPFHEMPRNGRDTSCCGAGGGRMWFDDKPEERVGNSRVAEAAATGAKTLAVGCPFCLLMMTDEIAASGEQIQARDVAEIMADRLPK